MKERKELKIGSIVCGMGLGILIGLYLSLLLPTFFEYSPYIITLGLIGLFTYFAYHKPVFIEYLAYAISIFVILQYSWDYAVGDRGPLRLSLFVNAVLLLLLNLTTGHVKLIGAKNTTKRALGLS